MTALNTRMAKHRAGRIRYNPRMGDIAVYVATTAGPVRVERIIGEDAPLSQVYQGRAYRPLDPVSGDYGGFLSPSGPVARAFGPLESRSFRLEVSAPLGTGNSWELGFFVAHGLHRLGRLAAPGQPASRLLLLSGRVDIDLRVGSVGHIAEKVRAAVHLLSQAEASGVPAQLVLPSADIAALPANILPEGTTVAAVEDARQAIGLALPGAAGVPAGPLPAPARRRLGLAAGLIAAASLAGFLAVGGLDLIRGAGKDGSASGVPEVSVFERRAPAGATCAEVQFDKVAPRLIAVVRQADGNFAPSRQGGLCGLAYMIRWTDDSRRGAAFLDVVSGRYLEPPSSSRSPGAVVGVEAGKPWIIDLPIRHEAPFVYRLVAAQGGAGLEAALEALKNGSQTLKQIRSAGVFAAVAGHRVEP